MKRPKLRRLPRTRAYEPPTLPLTVPPRVSDLAKLAGESVQKLRLFARAEVMPTLEFGGVRKVPVAWANRFIERGLTEEETAKYLAYTRKEKRRPEAPLEGEED